MKLSHSAMTQLAYARQNRGICVVRDNAMNKLTHILYNLDASCNGEPCSDN